MMAYSESMFKAELAKYYDVMHQHRNYYQECQFADSLIQKYHPGAKHVLDIGCGTGEHAIKMAQLGYEVTGIDISPDMLSIAKEKAQKAGLIIDFKCIDIHELNVISEFQAAYCLGYTFLYMTTHPEVVNFFTAVNKALLHQGIFLVDFINGWSLIEVFDRDKFVYQHEDTTIFQFEQASLDKKRRVKNIEFYYIIDSHEGQMKTIFAEEDLRIFFNDEVQTLLSGCGFSNIESFGDRNLDGTALDVPYIITVTGIKRDGL